MFEAFYIKIHNIYEISYSKPICNNLLYITFLIYIKHNQNCTSATTSLNESLFFVIIILQRNLHFSNQLFLPSYVENFWIVYSNLTNSTNKK